MALDGILLSKIIPQIRSALPLRIQKIQDVSGTELLFQTHGTGGKKQLVRAAKPGVNIHSLPGANEPVISQTTSNAIANYTGEMVFVKGDPWIKVSWGGKSGWILAKYVQIM
jgi:hypothetical protein